MRLTAILLFLTSLAYGQVQRIERLQELYWLGNHDTIVFDAKGYVTMIVEPKTVGDEYIYTIIRQKKVLGFDSTTVEYNNNHTAIVYSSGWSVGANQAKFYNGDFHYGTTGGTRSATFTYTSDKQTKVRFWSERYSGHGQYQIKVDNGAAVTINAGVAPFGSDKDRGLESWSSVILPPGTHTVTITTSAQMVVDRFTVTTYTPK